jgi:hypothetical protein
MAGIVSNCVLLFFGFWFREIAIDMIRWVLFLFGCAVGATRCVVAVGGCVWTAYAGGVVCVRERRALLRLVGSLALPRFNEPGGGGKRGV